MWGELCEGFPFNVRNSDNEKNLSLFFIVSLLAKREQSARENSTEQPLEVFAT